MGVAVGDYDGDGFPDLYVTQYGRSILYHNNGDGTFTDVTEKAGVAAPGGASSAVWFDYDNDGRLDLSFADSSISTKPNIGCCGDKQLASASLLHPARLQAAAELAFSQQWRRHFHRCQQGDRTSPNILGKAWGVVAADINNDGRMDLFVANDTVANFLFVNRGKGSFEEIGLAAGRRLQRRWPRPLRHGRGRRRFRRGRLDGSLRRQHRPGNFLAVSQQPRQDFQRRWPCHAGIGMSTRWMSGWGLKFFDYDNDGDLDLILANGFPDDLIDQISLEVTYKEPLLLFQKQGAKFKNVSAQSGPVFSKQFPARGLAVGDFNNDGGLDVLVSNNDSAPLLLRNNIGKENNWLGLKLTGKNCNPDAVGARVTYQAGDLKRSRTKVGGGSFLSSHDPRVILGIGKRPKIDWIEIKWPQPSGAVERFTDLPLNRYITIVEGAGNWK